MTTQVTPSEDPKTLGNQGDLDHRQQREQDGGAIALCCIRLWPDTLSHVLSFLGESSLLVVGCVNKRFHHLVSYCIDWEACFLRRFPLPNVIEMARSQCDDWPLSVLSSEESSLPAELAQRRLWKRQFVEQMRRSRYRKLSTRLIREAPGRHVYPAFDEREGLEVAWHDVDANETTWQRRHEISKQFQMLRRLHHPCILQVVDFWINPPSTGSPRSSPLVGTAQQKVGSFVVITELANSGTLGEFLAKNHPNRKSLKMRLVRRWCHQILRGLNYLHSPFQRVQKSPSNDTIAADPTAPTLVERKSSWIHGNLSCACIFVDAMRGEVRIGDIGMSLFVAPSSSSSPSSDCIARNRSCDIRSLGLMTLEILMGDSPNLQPYSDSLSRIADSSTASFLDCCLNHPLEWTTGMLLKHPFFAIDKVARTDDHSSGSGSNGSSSGSINSSPSNSPTTDCTSVADILHRQGTESQTSTANNSPSNKETRTQVQSVPVDLLVKIRDAFQQISFKFQCNQDTPESVAREIVLNCIHSSEDIHNSESDEEVLGVEVDLLAGEIRRQLSKKLGGAASPSAPSTPRGSNLGSDE